MKFYLDGEDCPWVVNVGGEAAQCFLSGERCEFGEPLRIKAGDIVKVPFLATYPCLPISVLMCLHVFAVLDWRDGPGILCQLLEAI